MQQIASFLWEEVKTDARAGKKGDGTGKATGMRCITHLVSCSFFSDGSSIIPKFVLSALLGVKITPCTVFFKPPV